MMDAESVIRAHVREMDTYQPIYPFEVLAQRLGRTPEEIVKLDANENPYGTHPAVLEALGELAYAHIYPDPECSALREAIAARIGVPVENIMAGAGADELIDLIVRLFLEPGETLLNCPPTFGMYAFDAGVNAVKLINVPRREDFSLDVTALDRALDEHRPKLLFLASPNNPDGGVLAFEDLERLLARPLVVVLDEAYVQFAKPGSSRVGEVLARQNLIVLQTFSKWAGLAGMRVGYGVFPGRLMPYLWKIKQPYNVSAAAAKAAIASLENMEALLETVETIKSERMRLYELLEQVPFLLPYPSQANFVLCKVVGRPAAQLKQTLEGAGILVRYFDKPGLGDHIRISVGKPAHTDALLNALAAME